MPSNLKVIKPESKRCSKCGNVKPFADFNRHKGHLDGLASHCRICVKAKKSTSEYQKQSLESQRKWRAKNGDRVKAWSKRFRESEYGKVWIRNDSVKRLYGITLEQYDAMYAKQNGCCAICKTHQSELSKRLNVDHDHLFGNIRELLCHGCNTALGAFKESPELLQAAMEYIFKHGGK